MPGVMLALSLVNPGVFFLLLKGFLQSSALYHLEALMTGLALGAGAFLPLAPSLATLYLPDLLPAAARPKRLTPIGVNIWFNEHLANNRDYRGAARHTFSDLIDPHLCCEFMEKIDWSK